MKGMKAILLGLALWTLDVAYGQANLGDTVAGGLAGALLNTFFPRLKPVPAPVPVEAPKRPLAGPPGTKQELPVALTGVGQLPPVDFPHGFPPTFVGLTNPENQNGFNIPMGLQGRTDLPPDYVYPFAPPGSVIKPDLNNGEVFSLGQRGSVQAQQQSQPGGGILTSLLGPLDLSRLAVDNTQLLQPVGGGLSVPTGVQLGPPGTRVAPPAPVHAPSAKVVGSTPVGPTTRVPTPSVPVTRRVPPRVEDPPQPPQPVVNYGSSCPQCVPMDLKRLAGPWIQVYGNPNSLRNIYTAILNLQSLYGDESTSGQTAAIQPSCIGMQFSRPHSNGGNHSESSWNLYFRDDTINRQLHEAVGVIKQNTNVSPKSVLLKLPAFELPVCLVKAGPDTSTMYGYIVLTETLGGNRCRSYHVFARRSDAFFRDHNVEVAEFVKEQVESNSAQPVSVLPFPELCQLPAPASAIR